MTFRLLRHYRAEKSSKSLASSILRLDERMFINQSLPKIDIELHAITERNLSPLLVSAQDLLNHTG